jgi:hypothetical protein
MPAVFRIVQECTRQRILDILMGNPRSAISGNLYAVIAEDRQLLSMYLWGPRSEAMVKGT